MPLNRAISTVFVYHRFAVVVAHDQSGVEIWATDETGNLTGPKPVHEFPAPAGCQGKAADDQQAILATAARAWVRTTRAAEEYAELTAPAVEQTEPAPASPAENGGKKKGK